MLNDIAYNLFLWTGFFAGCYVLILLDRWLKKTERGKRLLKKEELLGGIAGLIYLAVCCGAIFFLEALFGTGYPSY